MRRRRRIRYEAPTTDSRPPETRLGALIAEPDVERRRRIMRRIHDPLLQGADPLPWIHAACALHDDGAISTDAMWYFARAFTEGVLAPATDTDEELLLLDATMKAIERQHGLREEETFYVDDAPEEWRETNVRWDRRADELTQTYLREHGFAAIADRWAQDPEAFDEATLRAERELWPEDEDDATEYER